MVSTLACEEVLAIHDRVVEDFADDADPVGLGGPREEGRLLESVVARQHVGFGDAVKYPDPLSNAATLAFGLCCGHPFHNGNRRTALVAMLAHLDRNRLTSFGARQNELYRMIKAVATHTLGVRPDPRNKRRKYTEREADEEVAAIAVWLKRYARAYERGERILTYKQLRKVLRAGPLPSRSTSRRSTTRETTGPSASAGSRASGGHASSTRRTGTTARRSTTRPTSSTSSSMSTARSSAGSRGNSNYGRARQGRGQRRVAPIWLQFGGGESCGASAY